jgi:nucleoside-diphosphate-sugar epimerase
MIAKSFLVSGAMNFVAANLIKKLIEFRHYRIAAIDENDGKDLNDIRDEILFEKTNIKNISSKYNFDVIIDFSQNKDINNPSFVNINFDNFSTFISFSECYGPGQNIKCFIPDLIITAINQNFLKLQSDGSKKRNLIYVDDLSDAIIKILHFGNSLDYDVSSDEEIEDLFIARQILKSFQLPLTLIDYNFEENIVKFGKFDNSKVKKIGWRPRNSFDVGLIKTIAWYKKEFL